MKNQNPFKKYCNAKKITLKDAAEELGVSPATPFNIARGQVSIPMAIKIEKWSDGAVKATSLCVWAIRNYYNKITGV